MNLFHSFQSGLRLALAVWTVGMLTSCALPPMDENWAGMTPMERIASTANVTPSEPVAALSGDVAVQTKPSNLAQPSFQAEMPPVSSQVPPLSLDHLSQKKRLPYQICVDQALRHNLKANIARLNTDATALEENVAKAKFDPTVRLNGITYPGTPDDQPEGNVMMKKKFLTGAELRAELGTAFTNNTDRGLDFSSSTTEHAIRLTQPLLRGAGIAVNRAPMDLAKITTASAGAMARAEVMEVLRATESGYWTAVWAKESLRVQNDSLARSRQVEAEVREKHRLGAANKIDQLEAQAAVSAAQEQVERASQRFKDAVSNLTYLIGLVPGDVPDEVSFESLKVLTQAQIDPEARYQQALRLNPQEVLLANEIERWTIESKVARNARLPAVNLEISHGTNGLIGYSPRSSSGDQSSNNWSAFLQVSIPWTSRAERAQAEQAKLNLERSELAREDGRRQLRRDIFEAVREIESGRRQLDAANEGVQVNLAKWNEQLLRHKEGVVSVRDLREAEAELQQASLRALTSQLGVLVADARLARLDGSILERNALTF